jgi:transcriptional regulator with GAF, ATPase, and Fis domain
MGSETKPSSAEDRYRILLEVSEAANAQLDFVAVLEAVSRVLGSVVPVDVIGVATVNGDMVRAHGIHVVGHERKGGESFVDAGHGHVHTAFNPGSAPTVFIATFFEAPETGPLLIPADPGC